MIRLAALAAVAFLAAGCVGGLGLTEHQMRKQAKELESYSSEGVLLAHLIAQRQTKATFAGTHAHQMAIHAARLETRLEHAHPRTPQLADKRRKAVTVAHEVVHALQELSASPGDTAVALRVEDELASAEDEAKKLGE